MKKTITTSKQQLFALCIATALALFATGCSNDDDERNKGKEPAQQEQQKDGSTLVDAGGVKFAISEQPFDVEDSTSTRANQQPTITDTVEVAEGVEAEITIEPERPLPATRATPKQLRDGHYHVFAYQGGVRKGWMHFVVQGGQLQAWGRMQLPAGYYDLCCFNEKVAYPSDYSWFGMNIGNAGEELFGVAQNVYIGGYDYEVPIKITHHSARIRTKLVSMMDFPTDVRTKLYSKPNTAPENIVYRPATRSYETSGTTTVNTVNTTAYTASADMNVSGKGVMKTMVANDWQYVMSGTRPADMIMHITNGGKLYNKLMYSFQHMGISSSTQQFQSNRSYTISVKLLPSFKYVFNDGSRGYLRQKGNRIPVALLLNDHLGVALSDAAPPDYPTHFIPHDMEQYQPYPAKSVICGLFSRTFDGDRNDFAFMQDNNALPGEYWKAAITKPSNLDGAFHTWDENGSSGFRGNGAPSKTGAAKIKGNNIADFPAFYWSDLHRKSLIKRFTDGSISYYAPLFQQGQWFLPSARQWCYVLDEIGMGNHDNFIFPNVTDQLVYTSCYSDIINYAFTQAGGAPLLDGYHYWTSVEWDNRGTSGGTYSDCAYVIIMNHAGIKNQFILRADAKGCTGDKAQHYRVRSFVKF